MHIRLPEFWCNSIATLGTCISKSFWRVAWIASRRVSALRYCPLAERLELYHVKVPQACVIGHMVGVVSALSVMLYCVRLKANQSVSTLG
jgi:hypothetical protein